MVSGTLRYQVADIAIAQEKMMGRRRMLSLWHGSLFLLVIGGVIGLGVGTLVRSAAPGLSPDPAFGALAGAGLAIVIGAWRFEQPQRAAKAAALMMEQSFRFDENGLTLAVSTAETRMNWSHFTATHTSPALIVLQTRDQTLVLLRPDFLDRPDEWSNLTSMITSRTSLLDKRGGD